MTVLLVPTPETEAHLPFAQSRPDATGREPSVTIRTRQSLSGFIASKPQLSVTNQGDTRFYAKVGHERHRRNEDGTFTRLATTFHDLVQHGPAAERSYAVFRKGDRFVAEGYIRIHQSGEEFVAQKLGHDAARTRYTVNRDLSPAARSSSANATRMAGDGKATNLPYRRPPEPGTPHDPTRST